MEAAGPGAGAGGGAGLADDDPHADRIPAAPSRIRGERVNLSPTARSVTEVRRGARSAAPAQARAGAGRRLGAWLPPLESRQATAGARAKDRTRKATTSCTMPTTSANHPTSPTAAATGNPGHALSATHN